MGLLETLAGKYEVAYKGYTTEKGSNEEEALYSEVWRQFSSALQNYGQELALETGGPWITAIFNNPTNNVRYRDNLRPDLYEHQAWAVYDMLYYAILRGHKHFDRRMKFGKRLSSYIYKVEQCILPDKLIAMFGEIAQAVMKPMEDNATFNVVIEPIDTNQPADHYYHRTSCWWGDYSTGRYAFKHAGGHAVTWTDPDGKLLGRCWALEDDGGQNVLFFNVYGNTIRNIMSALMPVLRAEHGDLKMAYTTANDMGRRVRVYRSGEVRFYMNEAVSAIVSTQTLAATGNLWKRELPRIGTYQCPNCLAENVHVAWVSRGVCNCIHCDGSMSIFDAVTRRQERYTNDDDIVQLSNGEGWDEAEARFTLRENLEDVYTCPVTGYQTGPRGDNNATTHMLSWIFWIERTVTGSGDTRIARRNDVDNDTWYEYWRNYLYEYLLTQPKNKRDWMVNHLIDTWGDRVKDALGLVRPAPNVDNSTQYLQWDGRLWGTDYERLTRDVTTGG